jgi:polyphosphate kinase 2 (PPK2 family)
MACQVHAKSKARGKIGATANLDSPCARRLCNRRVGAKKRDSQIEQRNEESRKKRSLLGNRLTIKRPYKAKWLEPRGQTILFEGDDAAGKGDTIKAITERVSPRVFRVVALPAPSERENLHPQSIGGSSIFALWSKSGSPTPDHFNQDLARGRKG